MMDGFAVRAQRYVSGELPAAPEFVQKWHPDICRLSKAAGIVGDVYRDGFLIRLSHGCDSPYVRMIAFDSHARSSLVKMGNTAVKSSSSFGREFFAL